MCSTDVRVGRYCDGTYHPWNNCRVHLRGNDGTGEPAYKTLECRVVISLALGHLLYDGTGEPVHKTLWCRAVISLALWHLLLLYDGTGETVHKTLGCRVVISLALGHLLYDGAGEPRCIPQWQWINSEEHPYSNHISPRRTARCFMRYTVSYLTPTSPPVFSVPRNHYFKTTSTQIVVSSKMKYYTEIQYFIIITPKVYLQTMLN